MPIEDIHELVEVLEKAGELKRISTEVDSDLELAEILRRTMYDNGQHYFLKMSKDMICQY